MTAKSHAFLFLSVSQLKIERFLRRLCPRMEAGAMDGADIIMGCAVAYVGGGIDAAA
jgi:hypothetical protein